MKAVMLFMLLGSVAFCQTPSNAESPSTALRTELRTSSNQVRMIDEMVVTVFFRSDKEITIWNFLEWGASSKRQRLGKTQPAPDVRERGGFLCSESEDGAQAIKYVERLRPDLIVCGPRSQSWTAERCGRL
jgi:hypothetical protein